MKRLVTPIAEEDTKNLHIGDTVLISGKIYCGRDAVLPRICELVEKEFLGQHGIDLKGSVIFHTAVSPAGICRVTCFCLLIASSLQVLSKAGVKLHLGKGAVSKDPIGMLDEYNAVYAVIPPVTALLKENTLSQRIAAFPELGMEAFYELEVRDFPAIIGAAHNESIY